jgi:hypothetical protein
MDSLVGMFQIYYKIPYHRGYGEGFNSKGVGPMQFNGLPYEKFTCQKGPSIDSNAARPALAMLARRAPCQGGILFVIYPSK